MCRDLEAIYLSSDIPLPYIALLCLARHLLHRHGVIPVESDRHHPDQLPASLHPQVPAQAFLTTELLQVDLLKADGNLRPLGSTE